MRHQHRSRAPSVALLTGAVLLFVASPAAGQYFGRNKVQYESFDWRIFRTPHFDAHFYPAESIATADAARMAERWYTRFSGLLGFNFTKRPLVFYADHPDFQQTNVIGGLISQGTGGVTESARNRAIMPFTGVYAGNDHVLGHEIVHVFQYAIADSLARTSRGPGINALPLWLIEGMAEYLSLGREDAHTAMWLRDAVLRDDLPTIRQLTTDGRYFPYRYGQALWAYIGGKWGDRSVNSLYRAALTDGFEPAIKRMLKISHDSLSREWHAAIRAAYAPLMEGMTRPADAGTRLLPGEQRDGQTMEISPALSPDGRWVAFLSARNLVSIDLFIADAETGRIVKQLTSPNKDAHFTALSFISAAGSWSPDARQLAYVTVADGDHQIAIFDVDRGEVVKRHTIDGVTGINDAAWGPLGEIAFSGMRGGISDLYVLDPKTGRTRQLTNDRFADLQPAWSPDGRLLAFATDRGAETDFARLTFGPMRLATIDVAMGAMTLLPAFEGAKHINPQFGPDGDELFFVSDRDGFSNIYRLALGDMSLHQVTRLATGVSGITGLSPAMTVAAQTGRMAYSVFHDAGEALYRLERSATRGVPIVQVATAAPPAASDGDDGAAPPQERVMRAAAILPPSTPSDESLVARYLTDGTTGLVSADSVKVGDFDSGLGIEYIGAPTIGLSVGGIGAGVGGAIQAYFSDMLNDKVVGATLYSAGGIKGFGAETFYLNQNRRLNWGVGGGHIPSIVGAGTLVRDTTVRVGGAQQRALVYDELLARVYIDQAAVMARYPLTATRRLEASLSANRQSYGIEGIRSVVVGNRVVAQDRLGDADLPSPVRYAQASLAYVGDYSSFGFTSPIAGGRYRFEASPMIGDLSFGTLLADYRRYIFMRPITLAFRGLHYGRYGADAENEEWLQPLYLGSSSLVRGYSSQSFGLNECSTGGQSGGCPAFDRLLGSRLAVASAELRIPVFGPRELALIPFFLPTEVAPFIDAGVAWTRDESPSFTLGSTSASRTPVVSAGVSTRFNLFGALVLDVFYAHPFQRPEKGGHWGFQLMPGW